MRAQSRKAPEARPAHKVISLYDLSSSAPRKPFHLLVDVVPRIVNKRQQKLINQAGAIAHRRCVYVLRHRPTAFAEGVQQSCRGHHTPHVQLPRDQVGWGRSGSTCDTCVLFMVQNRTWSKTGAG